MKMIENSTKKVENTVGKGEIARYEKFLLFPQFFFFFSKDLYRRHVKTRDYLGKGLTYFIAIFVHIHKATQTKKIVVHGMDIGKGVIQGRRKTLVRRPMGFCTY